MPHGLTRFGSCTAATPGRSDTRLVCRTVPDNSLRISRVSTSACRTRLRVARERGWASASIAYLLGKVDGKAFALPAFRRTEGAITRDNSPVTAQSAGGAVRSMFLPTDNPDCPPGRGFLQGLQE